MEVGFLDGEIHVAHNTALGVIPVIPYPNVGECSLGTIGSVIGTPMFIDECTVGKPRVTYARILVEVDIT